MTQLVTRSAAKRQRRGWFSPGEVDKAMYISFPFVKIIILTTYFIHMAYGASFKDTFYRGHKFTFLTCIVKGSLREIIVNCTVARLAAAALAAALYCTIYR